MWILNMNWKEELGIQIRQARQDLFLTQRELRERAGVHVNMIGRYESGDSAPELDKLIQLAAALDLKEFQIGEHTVLIRRIDAADAQAQPKQLRLEYGREYVFDAANSCVKIQPSREGLFILPQKRKAAG